VHRELKRKHVTLQTLWEECIEAHPDGYRYSRYCDLYRGWEGRLPVTMGFVAQLRMGLIPELGDCDSAGVARGT